MKEKAIIHINREKRRYRTTLIVKGLHIRANVK